MDPLITAYFAQFLQENVLPSGALEMLLQSKTVLLFRECQRNFLKIELKEISNGLKQLP